MADYCNTCDPELGVKDDLCEPGLRMRLLCECCGPTIVDTNGNCMSIICTCSTDRCVHSEPNKHNDRKFCGCSTDAPPHWLSECPRKDKQRTQ